MKKFTSKKQKVGEIGENIACIFLEKNDFQVIERNYTKKCGEIDIIAKQADVIHFIEVKSVSCESFEFISSISDEYRPEDQANIRKLKKISRTIETYLAKHKTGKWQFDLVCVYLNHTDKIARVKILSDIIL